jgi:hypothetical protein
MIKFAVNRQQPASPAEMTAKRLDGDVHTSFLQLFEDKKYNEQQKS